MSISPEYRTPSGAKRRRVRVYDASLGRSVHVGVAKPEPATATAPARTTLQVARDMEAAAILDRTLPTPQTMTVAQLADLFLAVKAREVSAGAHEFYARTLKPFVREFGAIKLRDFDRPLAAQISARSSTTTGVASAMWALGTDAGLTRENVWRGLQKKKKRRLKPGWLTLDQVNQMRANAHDIHGPIYGPMWDALIAMAAFCGPRPAELAAIRRTDLDDPAEGLMTIRRQAHHLLRAFTPPKNGLERTVSYPTVVQDAVAAAPILHDELLFVANRGGVLWPSARHYSFDPIRRSIGKPKLVLHELRHFAATWLSDQGVGNADVAFQLGHLDNGALVASTYSHPDSTVAIRRVQMAHALLAGEPPTTDPTTQAEEAAS